MTQIRVPVRKTALHRKIISGDVRMKNQNLKSLFGPAEKYSKGTAAVMADRQIKLGVDNGTVRLDCNIENGETAVTYLLSGKWFVLLGGLGDDNVRTAMMGAACGDVAGSVYERNNIKYKPNADNLIPLGARFTDDTVMTCAVAEGLRRGLERLPRDWMNVPEAQEVLFSAVRDAVLLYGRRYPYAGYGGSFVRWMLSSDPKPYNSWGNGSAMRASYAGWVACTLEEAERLAEISASITHDHPEGIKGAKATAGAIFTLRTGGGKDGVREYVGKYYDLNFTLDSIRASYRFDVSCAGSVPEAVVAFLEGESFTDVIANAISIGGDSDTIAAIAGSIAEVIYPIPQKLRGDVIDKMDALLLNTIADAVDFFERRRYGICTGEGK